MTECPAGHITEGRGGEGVGGKDKEGWTPFFNVLLLLSQLPRPLLCAARHTKKETGGRKSECSSKSREDKEAEKLKREDGQGGRTGRDDSES